MVRAYSGILVTGVEGFVGHHLVAGCRRQRANDLVFGTGPNTAASLSDGNSKTMERAIAMDKQPA